MKRQLFLTACAFALGITGTMAAKASFTDSWYSIAPGACDYPASLPGTCVLTSPGTLCTSGMYTYYRDPNCIHPWYKPS